MKYFDISNISLRRRLDVRRKLHVRLAAALCRMIVRKPVCRDRLVSTGAESDDVDRRPETDEGNYTPQVQISTDPSHGAAQYASL